MEAKHAAAREIALAIGVPPMLLGIPGDNTYANYAEANRAFWRQTVLPLVQRTARALGMWLAPAYGGELRLAPDLDAVEALSPEREALWARMERASFLSDAEKRAAVGYGAKGTGSNATKFNPYHAGDGRFDFSPDGAQVIPTAGKHPPHRPKPHTPHAKPERAPKKPKQREDVPIPEGMRLRNQDLAGQNHPKSGIPFDNQGFPDFRGVATHTVELPSGHSTALDRGADIRDANRLAGFDIVPEGMTWHHHQDGRTMQLVPRDIHDQTGHTGPIGIERFRRRNR